MKQDISALVAANIAAATDLAIAFVEFLDSSTRFGMDVLASPLTKAMSTAMYTASVVTNE